MANAKIIEQKSLVVDEIKGKFENAKSVVVFDPRGLNVAEVTELRRALRESGSDYKVNLIDQDNEILTDKIVNSFYYFKVVYIFI